MKSVIIFCHFTAKTTLTETIIVILVIDQHQRMKHLFVSFLCNSNAICYPWFDHLKWCHKRFVYVNLMFSTIAIVCVSTAHCSVVILKIDRWFARKKTGSKLVWKMVEKAFKSFDRTPGCSHFYSNLTFLWSIFVEFSRCIYHYVHIDGGVVRFFVADAWYV